MKKMMIGIMLMALSSAVYSDDVDTMVGLASDCSVGLLIRDGEITDNVKGNIGSYLAQDEWINEDRYVAASVEKWADYLVLDNDKKPTTLNNYITRCNPFMQRGQIYVR